MSSPEALTQQTGKALVEVRIPSVLRQYTGGARSVRVAATSVAELLRTLDQRYPGLAAAITDADGRLHEHIGIFIDDEDIRYRQDLATPLQGGEVVHLIFSLGGG